MRRYARSGAEFKLEEANHLFGLTAARSAVDGRTTPLPQKTWPVAVRPATPASAGQFQLTSLRRSSPRNP